MRTAVCIAMAVLVLPFSIVLFSCGANETSTPDLKLSFLSDHEEAFVKTFMPHVFENSASPSQSESHDENLRLQVLRLASWLLEGHAVAANAELLPRVIEVVSTGDYAAARSDPFANLEVLRTREGRVVTVFCWHRVHMPHTAPTMRIDGSVEIRSKDGQRHIIHVMRDFRLSAGTWKETTN